MDCGIYKITCNVNGKIYIGSSKNIEIRWNSHKQTLKNKSHKNPHLQNAWDLYGEGEFTFHIIEICDQKDLLMREQFWMDNTNCYDRSVGFNNTIKSNSPTGYKHTEEHKKLMSDLKKGVKQDSSSIHKRVEKLKGLKRSDETKEKLRQCKIGEKNPMFGKKEDLSHKLSRMKNLHSKPKWNKGLTKKDDPRIEKLAVWKNKTPPNAKKATLIDLQTDEIWVADSIIALSKISPLSNSSLRRLIKNEASENITKRYKIIINE